MVDIYAVLDSLSEFLYVADNETHEILYMNKLGKELFGEVEGKKCYEFFEGRTEMCEHCPREQLSKTEFYTWEKMNELNGKVYMRRVKLIDWGGRSARLEVAFDLTAEENRKREVENRLDMELFVVKCITELHKMNSLDEILNNIIKMTGEFLDADRVYIFDYDGKTTNNTHEWCKEGISSEIEWLQGIEAHKVGRWVSEFKKGNCIIIEDLETIREISPGEYKDLKRQNINSLVVSPLEYEGDIIGYIGVDNPPKGEMMKSEMFFSTLSYFISSSIVTHKQKEKLQEVSYMDSLTGLYNRNKFIVDSETAVTDVNAGFGVVYLDLNGLKEINDKKGHAYGDKALCEIADVVVKSFGKESSYRVGGDEFVILCVDLEKNSFFENVSKLKHYLSKLEYTAAMGYHYSESVFHINDIIKIADKKMYFDKKNYYKNKKEMERFNQNDDEYLSFSTVESIKKLIEEEKFVIWFQPRFNLETGEFSGAEALIRYFGEDDIVISPEQFIPKMEEKNTIHMIDFYVFKHVCEYISDWIKRGKKVKPISVNFSQNTLSHVNFIENLMNIWYDYGIPKELIEIEVSEDNNYCNSKDVVKAMSELKKCGFKIVIDNFGEKYANLYLFSDLKFDILKIDKDLVSKIQRDYKTRSLAKIIVKICNSSGIKIVAEGVENEDQLQNIKDIKCDEAQGFYFDKAMSWNWFEEKYL